MSLYAIPVTVSDLTTLQQGIEFSTDTIEATAQAGAINNGAETVFSYAAELINANLPFSQVAMATTALMFGETATTAVLQNISLNFLPSQVAVASANGVNVVVFAAQAAGLALAGSPEFATFTALSATDFAHAVAVATGVNETVIDQWLTNWTTLYTGNPSATQGLSVSQAAYGATFGNAIGVALLNPTSANLQTVVTDTEISGVIANALLDNAEGSYAVGVPIGSLPIYQPLQGQAGTLNVTVNGNVTVDMAQNPTIGVIIVESLEPGFLTINNQTNPLTVNLQDSIAALTVGAVGPAPGLNDSLSVVLGTASNTAFIGPINVTGDEVFTLTALGPQGADPRVGDIAGLITLTPTLGGNVQVTLGGNRGLTIGFTADQTLGAIADATAGVLNQNNLSIKITNTAVTAFAPDSVPGTLLNFVADAVPPAFQAAPSIPYSTNAVTIDASTSGGLFMLAGDANFDHVTSAGNVITGAANPVGINVGAVTIGNILGGSIGNDIIASKSLTLPDYIFTDGGADKVTLAAGHTGADHVAFYAVSNVTFPIEGDIVLNSVTNAISEPFLGPPALQFVNPGWWGVGAGDASNDILALFSDGTGTSLDNSTLTGFVPNQDFLDLSVKAWGDPVTGVNGFTVDTVVLQAGGLAPALVNANSLAGFSSDTGVGMSSVAVAPGGSIVGSSVVGTGAALISLSQGTFLDANAVASVLSNGTYTINHSAAQPNVNYDFLIGYQGLDGSAHIADLHILGNGTTSTATDPVVSVSDIVTVVGVTLPELLANVSHIHLVT